MATRPSTISPMQSIRCPHCNQQINLDDAISHQLESKLDEQTKQLKLELWQKAQTEAAKKVEGKTKLQLEELQIELKTQQERAQKAELQETELRQKQRQLLEREQQLKLQIERELDQRLQQERAKTVEQEQEKHGYREKELMKQIEDMKVAVEAAQRKANVSSQQRQGEVMELELEDQLKQAFPEDEIAEVKKGQLGADAIQHVYNRAGKKVGTIVWESKQTEKFSEGWLPKLREDTRSVQGHFSVLVTRALPPGVTTAVERDRVWIISFPFVLPIASLLRQTLLSVDLEKASQSGKEVKTELLYRYINSQEFRGRIEAIVESFHEMQSDLEREQRAMQQIWKKREKQLLRMATSTAYMYGEMQGLMGASLPGIQGLELESVDKPYDKLSAQTQFPEFDDSNSS